MTEPEEPIAHIQLARKIFRDVGFDISAMRYPRPVEALAGLRRFNNVPDSWKEPFAWRFFPNAYMRDNWQRYY